MAIKLNEKIKQILEESSGARLTGKEIAERLIKKFPGDFQRKKDESAQSMTEPQFLNQISAEIGSRRENLRNKYDIESTDDSPRKYYLTSAVERAEPNEATFDAASSRSESSIQSEEELYPLLINFVKDQFKVSAVRIVHNITPPSDHASNKWLHPDVVGLEDLMPERSEHKLQSFYKESGSRRLRLWSFEVKNVISKTTVRMDYFQAVANSSWANMGYLVGRVFNGGVIDELRILHSRFGIGVIKIGDEKVPGGIILPAIERFEIDWGTVNRLSANKGFESFIDGATDFLKTGKMPGATSWSRGD